MRHIIDEPVEQYDHDLTSSAGQITQPLARAPLAQSVAAIPPFLQLMLGVMILVIGCALATIILVSAFG